MTHVIAALVLAAPILADFDPASDRWNGLTYIRTTASEAKVDLEIARVFDWSAVVPDDTLVFVSPGASLDPSELVSFIEEGGQAVVAVDVDAGDAALRAFGLRRSPDPLIHDAYYRDHPAFPELRPARDHFLWYNVESVVLNHPAALSVDPAARGLGQPTPIVTFLEPTQLFAVEVARGQGRILFLSDASLFINDMQRHSYGDKQLAANALRYFCDSTCEVTLIPPGARSTGTFRAPRGDGFAGVEELFARAVTELNDLAPVANETLGKESILGTLTWSLVLCALLAGALLPWPRAARRFVWQSSHAARRAHLHWHAAAMAGARDTADFAVVAAALRRRFERSLSTVPGAAEALGDERRLSAALAAALPAEIARAALRCQSGFTKLRQAGGGDPRPRQRMELAEFEALSRDCETVHEGLRRG